MEKYAILSPGRNTKQLTLQHLCYFPKSLPLELLLVDAQCEHDLKHPSPVWFYRTRTLVWKYHLGHGQSDHLVNVTAPLLHRRIGVQHFLDHLAIRVQQVVFLRFQNQDGLFQLLRKNGFFLMHSLNLEFFLNVKILTISCQIGYSISSDGYGVCILKRPRESEMRHVLTWRCIRT